MADASFSKPVRRKKTVILALAVILFLLLLGPEMFPRYCQFSCRASSQLKLQRQSGLFTYYACDGESVAVRDISALMDSAWSRICVHLGVQYKRPVRVDVYPTQEAYDSQIMNPSMRGTPAVSGSRRIQIVSPQSPIAVQGIPYEERLWFSVHEFTHLVIDEISDSIPGWLDEGMACYEGSYNVYSFVCGHTPPSGELPTLSALVNAYDRIVAADVYSFSLVEFLISRHGRAKVNRLLRKPGQCREIFGQEPDIIWKEWKSYVASRYGWNAW